MKEKILTLAALAILAGLFVFTAMDGRLPWAAAPAPGPDWCIEHDVAESACTICHPELARGGTSATRIREPKPGECANTLVSVRLGPGAAEEVRLAVHTTELRPVAESIRANAETQYPPSRYARVAPRLPGVVREVRVVLGEDVSAGAVLAVFESSEFVQAKADYLQALALAGLREKTHAQEKELYDKKISAGRELLEAESALGEARLAERRALLRLLALGLGEADAKALATSRDLSPLVEVKAPFDGRVVDASAVPGESAGPEKPLFAVAAIERLWISIDLAEADLPKVARDQRAWFSTDGLPGRRFAGRVVAVGGEVDERTRTVRVFAEIKNPDGLLRAKTFGRAEIEVKPAEPKLLVPKEAVQNDGDCTIVFVSTSKDVFQARKVQLGAAYEGGFEVAGGLAAGESVVTRGSFLLKTEVLRGQMGAGCCPKE